MSSDEGRVSSKENNPGQSSTGHRLLRGGGRSRPILQGCGENVSMVDVEQWREVNTHSLEFSVVYRHQRLVNLHFSGCKCRRSDEFKRIITKSQSRSSVINPFHSIQN